MQKLVNWIHHKFQLQMLFPKLHLIAPWYLYSSFWEVYTRKQSRTVSHECFRETVFLRLQAKISWELCLWCTVKAVTQLTLFVNYFLAMISASDSSSCIFIILYIRNFMHSWELNIENTPIMYPIFRNCELDGFSYFFLAVSRREKFCLVVTENVERVYRM